jgi:hypothetical protein
MLYNIIFCECIGDVRSFVTNPFSIDFHQTPRASFVTTWERTGWKAVEASVVRRLARIYIKHNSKQRVYTSSNNGHI